DRVECPGVGVAVFLEAALEEYHQARLAPRGRAQQQQQPSANFRAGARRLEVVDQPLYRVVDAVKLVLEQLTAQPSLGVIEALGAHHVPDVLVAAARKPMRIGGKDGLEKLGEGPGPVRRAVLLAVVAEGPDKTRAPLAAIVEARCRNVHG